MHKHAIIAGAVIMLLGWVGAATAGEQLAHVTVESGIPEPLVAGGGNADAGREVMVNRKQGNCLACHVISEFADQPFHGEVGPPLDGVADRWEEPQLRLIVVNSKTVFEGTIMPAFYTTDGLNRVAKKFKDKTILTAEQVEDVVAYLLTLKD